MLVFTINIEGRMFRWSLLSAEIPHFWLAPHREGVGLNACKWLQCHREFRIAMLCWGEQRTTSFDATDWFVLRQNTYVEIQDRRTKALDNKAGVPPKGPSQFVIRYLSVTRLFVDLNGKIFLRSLLETDSKFKKNRFWRRLRCNIRSEIWKLFILPGCNIGPEVTYHRARPAHTTFKRPKSLVLQQYGRYPPRKWGYRCGAEDRFQDHQPSLDACHDELDGEHVALESRQVNAYRYHRQSEEEREGEERGRFGEVSSASWEQSSNSYIWISELPHEIRRASIGAKRTMMRTSQISTCTG